jgi:non-canonical purine NTP pyrophosphatase (RdgB/HAM1 family)
MMTALFVLVTGNRGKIAEARLVIGEDLEAVALDLPEIQSLDLGEILREKAEEAWRRIGRPLVIEDVSLELAAFNGFPGPLVKWMFQALGAEGIARAAAAQGDVRATARCGLFYKDADRTLAVEGISEGTLVAPGRGEPGFGWNPVFQPVEAPLTYAEMSGTDRLAISHRGRAWRALMAALG